MTNTKKVPPTILLLYRTAEIFTVLDLLITALYFTVIVPMIETPSSEILGGGIKISHRGVMLAISFVVAVVWGLLMQKKADHTFHSSITHHFGITALAYTAQIAILACIHGLYLVTYYNKYVGIASPLLRGPSFMLSFAALLFALLFPFLRYILQHLTLLRSLLYGVGLMLLAFLSYVIFAGAFVRTSSFLILCTVFAVCYLTAVLLYFHLRSTKEQDENENSDYTPLYQTDTPKPDKVGAKPKENK